MEKIDLNVEKTPWPLSKLTSASISSIVCINMLHISHWNCTTALFRESEKYLSKNTPLILYGPFKENGTHISKSNAEFDKSLQERNPDWGVRDIEEVNKIAIKFGFNRNISVKMPANNLSAIFIRH